VVISQDVGSQNDTSGKRRRSYRVGRAGARFGPIGEESPAADSEVASPTDAETTQELTPIVPAWLADAHEHADLGAWLSRPEAYALVRPYTHTRGRTRSSRYLALEALISAAVPASTLAGTLPSAEHQAVADLCAQPRSVAEVAALLSVPLGVARVLLGDLVDAGAVVVHHTAGDDGDGAPDLGLMGRVLVGLRRLA
jgi:uncharacterized protein DUF742